MIERLLAAERALEAGELDKAERLFGQVAEADARNAIAVVGLAEVAHRRGRHDEASDLVERALAIDPDDAAAERLRRVLASATGPLPAESALRAEPEAAPRAEHESALPAQPESEVRAEPQGAAPESWPRADGEAPAPETGPAAAPRRSLLERLLAWFRRRP
jgi:tetratricopeptide (TPR) repeat protein